MKSLNAYHSIFMYRLSDEESELPYAIQSQRSKHLLRGHGRGGVAVVLGYLPEASARGLRGKNFHGLVQTQVKNFLCILRKKCKDYKEKECKNLPVSRHRITVYTMY